MTLIPLDTIIEKLTADGVETYLMRGEPLGYFPDDGWILTIEDDKSKSGGVKVLLSDIELEDGVYRLYCSCYIPLPTNLWNRIDDSAVAGMIATKELDNWMLFCIVDEPGQALVKSGGLSFTLPADLVHSGEFGAVEIFSPFYLPDLGDASVAFLHRLLKRFVRQARYFSARISFNRVPHSPEVSP